MELDVLFEQRVGAHHHLGEAGGDQLFQLVLFAAGERSGEQRGDIPERRENLAKVKRVLRGEDFGGRQHGHLVTVFDGDHGGFGCYDSLAAADVALQQAIHGMRLAHVGGDLLNHALLRAGGLERQHPLDALAHAFVDFECDAGDRARFGALQRHAALEPEELLEDQAELRRRAKGIEQAQVGIGRREVHVPDSGGAAGQLEAGAQMLG